MGLLLAVGCSVHEWPEMKGVKHPFTLHLNFDTVMDVHKIIPYDVTRTTDERDYDLRYIVRAYEADENGDELDREHEAEFIISKDGVHNDSLNHTVELELEEGNYRFFVWTDYVAAGTKSHKYYNTDNYVAITYHGDHVGSNDFRDAYRGEGPIEILPISKGVVNEVTIPMERPLAKFNVISTDLEEFITRALNLKAERAREARARGIELYTDEESRAINLDDYRIVFIYADRVAYEFNQFTNKPGWIATKTVQFESTILKLSESEAELGFDYVFVNGAESSTNIIIEVYDLEDELVAKSTTINVPLKRSKLTTVRGAFLTSKASGGVGISPGFWGTHDYPVDW